MSKELIAKIEKVEELTPSQKDKLHIQQAPHEQLCNFLQSTIVRMTSQNDLVTALESKFKTAIADTNPDTEMDLIVAVKIYEILKKSQSDADTTIISMFQKNPNVFVNVTQDAVDKASNDPKYSNDDIQLGKRLLKVLDRLEKSEVPEIQDDSEED